MDMRTARKSTNTYQYECSECGLKYAVGEQIVTGTMTPELLRSRGGRRAGHCHCGHRFATEFFDKKNPMWRLGNTTFFRPAKLTVVSQPTSCRDATVLHLK